MNKPLLTCVILLSICPFAIAQPSKLTHLYPSGLQRGTTCEVTIQGTFKSWPMQIWTDRDDVQITALKARGKLQIKANADAIPGICWIRIHDKNGASNLRPIQIGALPEITEQEPNNSPDKPHTLSTTRLTVNGQLAARGDVDVYAVSLKKGQTLVASMVAHEKLRSPMDAILQILSPKGFVLKQNNDTHGLDPQVIFTAPEDGLYLIRTFAFPATPNSTIGFAGGADYVYRLTLTTDAFADHAWPLAVSDPTEKIKLSGWNVPDALQPLLTKADSDFAIVHHPQLANAVSVRIEPHHCQIENPDTKPQRIEVPATVSGQITKPGEKDVYEFTLKKSESIDIRAEAPSLGSPLDPVLRLMDAKGNVIKTVQERRIGSDPTLPLTVKADTTYRLEVSDLYDHAGMRYTYRLRFAKRIPDFSLVVKADHFTFKPGKPLEIPITINRQNGFKEAIELRAEGLPKGVTAEMITSSASDKTATLKLKCDAKGISGSFQIVGQAKDTKLTRPVTAPLADFGQSTWHFWVYHP